MLSNKKISFYILLLSLLGISIFPSFVFAGAEPPYPVNMQIIGGDKVLTDQTNDLYREDATQFSLVSVQVSWIDLQRVSFVENGQNYTVAVELNGNYNESADLNIHIYLDINNSNLEAKDSYLNINIQSYENPSFDTVSIVSCNDGINSYAETTIHTISGKTVTFTFPISNITEIIPSIRPISEWKVLIKTRGSFLDTTYYDFMDINTENIPAYSLIIIGLVSSISVFFLFRKFKKS